MQKGQDLVLKTDRFQATLEQQVQPGKYDIVKLDKQMSSQEPNPRPDATVSVKNSGEAQSWPRAYHSLLLPMSRPVYQRRCL